MEYQYESLFIHEMVELENENCCVTPLALLLINYYYYYFSFTHSLAPGIFHTPK